MASGVAPPQYNVAQLLIGVPEGAGEAEVAERRRAAEQGLNLAEPVADYLLHRHSRDLRDLLATLERLDGVCGRTLRTQSVVEGMTRASHPIRYLGRRDFTAYVQAETVKYAALIRDSGLRQAD